MIEKDENTFRLCLYFFFFFFLMARKHLFDQEFQNSVITINIYHYDI